MKTLNALLAGILLVLIFIAVCVASRDTDSAPTPAQLAPPPHMTTRWRYEIERYSDDYSYRAILTRQQDITDFTGKGNFIYLDEQDGPLNDAKNPTGAEWEMCGCFMESGQSPELVVIFKQPLN